MMAPLDETPTTSRISEEVQAESPSLKVDREQSNMPSRSETLAEAAATFNTASTVITMYAIKPVTA